MIRPIAPILMLAAAIPAGAAPARHPAYEPHQPPPAASLSNLFRQAKCTASGHWSDRTPAFAVDGASKPADHWACENLPVWHRVDLGAAKKLSAIRAWPFWGDGRVYQYKVEGSADGKSWTLLGDMTANSIASTAAGDLFVFEPAPYQFIRTTFLENSAGREKGGHLVEIAGYATPPAAGLTGGVGTTDLRYPPAGKLELAPADAGIDLVGWRGERVSAQLVLSSAASHRHLRLDPLTLSGPAGIAAETFFVRHTLADGKPQGDILDHATTLDLAAGTNRPVWLQVDVPAATPPGTYTGTLTARSDSSQLAFPVRLEVLPATLPPPAQWSIHLDLWQHPDAVARWHDVPPWSDEHLALMKPLMRRLANAGQKTITTTLIHEPWGAQTYDWFSSMIEWRKQADGSWVYDYSTFDRWVGFMSNQAGFGDAYIHCYSMIPWSLSFRYFDEASRAWIDARLKPGSDEYDEFWGRFLRDFVDHLEEKGWLERVRIGMDERPDELMRGAMATLEKHAPMLEIASAINRQSEITRTIEDISPIIGHADSVTPADREARRQAGKTTTFYVCTSPPVPNTFTFSPPAESEWLPLFASARGLDGFLRWAYNSWVENPLASTDFTSWPSGDCFLVYPGNRSSVRFERLREGIENFEKIRLLRQWAAARPNPAAKAALATLDTVLADFSWQRGSKSGPHTGDVRRANTAILELTRAIGR